MLRSALPHLQLIEGIENGWYVHAVVFSYSLLYTATLFQRLVTVLAGIECVMGVEAKQALADLQENNTSTSSCTISMDT